jgi:hypothetical protein
MIRIRRRVGTRKILMRVAERYSRTIIYCAGKLNDFQKFFVRFANLEIVARDCQNDAVSHFVVACLFWRLFPLRAIHLFINERD